MSFNALQKENYCNSLLKTCNFANAQLDCVNRFCTGAPYSWGGCQRSGPTGFVPFPAQISHCCSSDDPNSCFAALQKGGSGSRVTAAPVPAPCATLTSLLSSCVAASSKAFVDGDAAAKAQCLCFGGGSYDPSRWDDAEALCYSLGPSSVGSSFWSAVSADGQGWCSAHAASAATATATATATGVSGAGSSVSVTNTSPGQATPTKSGAGGHVSLVASVKWASGVLIACRLLAF